MEDTVSSSAAETASESDSEKQCETVAKNNTARMVFWAHFDVRFMITVFIHSH